ncbi:MAG: hypothetical protein KGL39_02950 [Patescibacteria group bacterium]|nr:hypothetical protein [Patescibacteria group bacterium]
MKKIITVAAIVLSLSICLSRAQNPNTFVTAGSGTNASSGQAWPPAMNAPLPPDIRADLEKLFDDVLRSLNLSGGLQALFALWAAARVLRKALPDGMQANGFGQLLAHVALEVNPSLNSKTIQQAIAASAAQLAQPAPISPPKPASTDASKGNAP